MDGNRMSCSTSMKPYLFGLGVHKLCVGITVAFVSTLILFFSPFFSDVCPTDHQHTNAKITMQTSVCRYPPPFFSIPTHARREYLRPGFNFPHFHGVKLRGNMEGTLGFHRFT